VVTFGFRIPSVLTQTAEEVVGGCVYRGVVVVTFFSQILTETRMFTCLLGLRKDMNVRSKKIG